MNRVLVNLSNILSAKTPHPILKTELIEILTRSPSANSFSMHSMKKTTVHKMLRFFKTSLYVFGASCTCEKNDKKANVSICGTGEVH